MRNRFYSHISANTIQLVINQLFGLVIFYFLSTGLDKAGFGNINFALALLLALFNILSFGIDQVAVRKIAAGENPKAILSLYIIHVLITGLGFYLILIAANTLFPSALKSYNLLLLIAAGKLAIYFSTPFKQSAIGMERFRLLAKMSVMSNILRGVFLAILAYRHQITLPNVIYTFAGGDILELIIAFFFFKNATGLPSGIQWNRNAYASLIKESLPQLGVVVITSALARFDWLFIGIFVSAVKLAEYSFAYKVFELSALPLLAIAPVLIPRFTKMFKEGKPDMPSLKKLVMVEMAIALFTILVLNICWSPVIGLITHGKYGVVNRWTIFILSLCIPFQYLCNFYWTIYFARGQLKLILRAFIVTFVINIFGDIILIPSWHNEGAAAACLAGFIAQLLFFIRNIRLKDLE
ncbi:MAG TPA: oligosaccharide flippase family protein [Mucilaginibacter sp.]|jgi:O-antigen/teichoic acid export membrane protein|nr:oligosaccharide flippase family protein [Mucilaginibacter sp.]